MLRSNRQIKTVFMMSAITKANDAPVQPARLSESENGCRRIKSRLAPVFL
jgi:hypothetical protein